jgi:hypothetical protein
MRITTDRKKIGQGPEPENKNHVEDRNDDPFRFTSFILVRRSDVVLRIIFAFIIGLMGGAIFIDFLIKCGRWK